MIDADGAHIPYRLYDRVDILLHFYIYFKILPNK